MFQKLWRVIVILAFTLQIGVCWWSSYTDIRTDRVQLFSSTASGGVLTTTSVPTSYNISYSSSLSQTTSCGIGIVGFQTYLTNEFSINITITNFLATSMRITGIILDDTVVTYLSIHYIAVGPKTYFLQVQFYCFLPTVLSAGNGTRTQTKTSTTLFTNKALLCNVYLSGFRVHNSQGLANYLSASVTCPSGTSNLNYAFTTSENNTINQICYTTVIFCDVCTKSSANYYEWGQIGQTYFLNSALPSTSNINAILSRYVDVDRMFWGINSFNVSRGFTRGFNFQSDYFAIGGNIDTNYAAYSNSGTYEIGLNHFFIATRSCNLTAAEWFQVPTQNCVNNNSCWANLTYTLNGTAQYCYYCDYTCLTCIGSLATNCSTCSNTTSRYFQSNSCPCQSGYIDIGLANCYPCDSFMAGCNTCLTTSICTACNSGFTLNMLGNCQCTTGFLVTGVCTTLAGCISATNLQGTVYCLACDSTLNYVRSSNFTCICNTGFIMNAVEDCISICGDSIIVKGEGCDDGNTVSGDGCSSTCLVQTSYYCDNSNTPSSCYIIANITGTIKYVQRMLEANQAVFAIDLQPYYSDYLFMDFGGYISTDLPCDTRKVNYINNLLMVYCWYSSTIEGNNYTLNLTLDSKFFTNGSKVSISLPASGMNAKLTYDSNSNLSTPMQYMVILLDAIAIIILFISCVTERMIGVEMIQTLQSVLYSMALMKTCPSTLAPLQYLRYSNGYNEPSGIDPARRYTYTFTVGEVGLDQEFILNYNISYVILIGVIFLMLILKGVMLKFESDKASEQREFNRKFQMEQVHKGYRNIKKVFKFLFERVFFLLCFMNMFLIIFGVGIQLSNLKQGYLMLVPEFNLLLCGIAVCILITFLAMVIMNGIYPSINVFPMFMNNRYPVYYVIYNSTFIILVTFLYSQAWLLYALLGMTICNLIVLLIYLPYRQRIHNLTLAFNQATIIVALGAYLYEEATLKTNNNEGIFTILIFLIIAMLYLCVILSIYRLYRFYQYMKLHKITYYDNETDADHSEYKDKLSLKDQKMDVEIIENDIGNGIGNMIVNGKVDSKSSKALKPYENQIYENIKMNKNPLNTSRDVENAETKRDKSNNISRINKDHEDAYDTFSKTPAKSAFRIEPIDPNPVDVSGHRTPYNEFGDAKLHNYKQNEEEVDALKLIKARLRKDFYHKVHQTEYKQPQKVGLLNKTNEKPVNFLPSDYNDQE